MRWLLCALIATPLFLFESFTASAATTSFGVLPINVFVSCENGTTCKPNCTSPNWSWLGEKQKFVYASSYSGCAVIQGTSTFMGSMDGANAAQNYQDTFVRYPGKYRAVIYFCKSTSCDMNTEVFKLTGPEFTLSSTIKLAQQNVTGVESGMQQVISSNYVSFCAALVHTEVNYSIGVGDTRCRSSSKPEVSPPSPSCIVNAGYPLDVFMGETINAEDIGSVAGGYGVMQKSIPVTCFSEDTSLILDASATLTFTSMSGSSGTLLQTSNPGLGVIVTSNGTVMSNNVAVPITLAIGSNTLPMSFTPVHPDTIPQPVIATGPFNSSAVLVIAFQ